MKELVIFALLTLASGCKSQDGVNNNAETQTNATAAPDTVVLVVEKPVTPKDSLVIAFEKTPCYGRCPVYKVKVYASGFATYEGMNFVEKMGLYSTHFTQTQIENIYQDALKINYFALDAEYNNPNVTDLPSTISEINYNGKANRIRARMGVPDKLKRFHENLAVTLLEKDWKPYSNR